MIAYGEIKQWMAEKENRDRLMVAAGFVLIFFVGFGAGRYERGIRRENFQSQRNYTTTQPKKPLAEPGEAAVLGESITNPAVAANTATAPCIVKGNISSTGRKVFHVKGGAFYDRTKAEQCFYTEKEAIAAGFVKSQR